MRKLIATLSFCLSFGSLSTAVFGEQVIVDSFDNNPQSRWEFLADTVMGGVSTGQVNFVQDDGFGYARLTGTVSTEKRGGFIQVRKELTEKPPRDAKGVRLVTRGNGQTYFVHLRTRGTVLPWQFYQGNFNATQSWTEVRIPFSSFKSSGQMMRTEPKAESLKSIGIVAYGRDHEAMVDVKVIGFF
ncbi:CIA30 family protein [Phaeobacter sp. 11ANDIMAR09]|uniref:CIA30 family protein n=1 Tax=Phaeobacter sp. 11ANDIMAR09 TaxID=1225647 RepID=UPI0006C8DC6E|nr:CIA30 family protein [Phaeobacter sp. 11ANDIMAR09]KPD10548.1 NADH ubiquinone oxidoreductase [Phaeobacter sp. 11ANDIMAR09]